MGSERPHADLAEQGRTEAKLNGSGRKERIWTLRRKEKGESGSINISGGRRRNI